MTDSKTDSNTDSKTDSNTDSKTNSKTKEQKGYLQIFQEKQRNFYIENEKQSKYKKWLTQLKKRNYFLPKDLLNLVLSYIPEYSIIWFSNGEFNLSIKALSLHHEFTQNIGKVIDNRNSFVHHEINCDCNMCMQYNTINSSIGGISEYQSFQLIANAMGVQIAKLCPDECYDDYTQFKSDNPDIKKRIADYFYADWHRDSYLNLHISWMKRVCENRIEICYEILPEFCYISGIKRVFENRIEFCYELLPEFYKWAQKKRHYITYECMEAFIRKLLKVTIKPNATDSEHTYIIKDMCDKCNIASFLKKPHIIAKTYRYMAYAIDYIRRNPILRETSIRKAREFRSETDNIRVHLAIDSYLNILGLE